MRAVVGTTPPAPSWWVQVATAADDCLGVGLLVLGAEMKLGELGKVP